MNYAKLRDFNLWSVIDASLVKKGFEGKRRLALYPSEASVIAIDPETKEASVLGSCHRKSWYRLFGFAQSNPPSIKSEYIFEFGKQLEKLVTSLVKNGAYYNANSVKFWDQSTMVSGEIDLVVVHPDGGLIFVEVKSTYGYFNEKFLFGSRNSKGSPKDDHVLQLLTYLWLHKDTPNLLGGKLIYILRDNMSRAEFNVTIEPDVDVPTKSRVVIDGVPDLRFYVEDMMDRFLALTGLIKESAKTLKQVGDINLLEPPPQEYDLYYSDEQIEEYAKDGRVSKTAYAAYQKDANARPGDWQCGWCSYKDLCYGKDVSVKTYYKKRVKGSK